MFKWCLVRYLRLMGHNEKKHTHTHTNMIKTLPKSLIFKDIKLPVKIRHIHKIEKKNSTSIDVFGMKIRKNIQSMYQKNVVKKNMLIYY